MYGLGKIRSKIRIGRKKSKKRKEERKVRNGRKIEVRNG